MKHINVIYTIIKKQDKFAPFPYPPLYQEKDTDYICFTDNTSMESKFWEIQYLDQIDKFSEEEFLKDYLNKLYIDSNQILLKSKEEPNFLITIPDLYEIIEDTPDFDSFIPTANPDGTYHIEPNPEYHSGAYDGHPFLLTIGVPVSNQIQMIRRCLDGVRPILEAISSELLVIDTGSNDGTVEVAQEYQARVVYFPWCNNMAAARNYGIKNAKGAWYMSIDDDEWFESVEDIIDFFQSGKYKNYLFASYIQRNYHSFSLITYDDALAPRIAKITSFLHFEGRIHDSLIGIQEKDLYCLNDIAHHTRFHRDNKEDLVIKVKRNLSFLYFDLYEYPRNLRYTYQIANEFNVLFQANYAAAYLYRGLSVNQEVNDMYYQKLLLSHLLVALYTERNPELFSHAQVCLSSVTYTISELALIHYMLFQLAVKLEYEISLIEKEASEYEYYRDKYLRNFNQKEAKAILYQDVCKNSNYLSSYQVARFSVAIRKQDETEAEYWLNQIDLTQASQDTALVFCDKIIYCKTDSLIERGLQMITDYIFSLSREKIASFASMVWNKYTTESKNVQDSLGFIFFQHFIADPDYDKFSVHMQYWLAILGEKLFLVIQKEDDNIYFPIFFNYITALYTYAVHYYNAARFSEDSPLIPENIRATYHIMKSLEAAERNNHFLCMEELKFALHTFPGFKRGISLLLEQLKNETQEAPSTPENEIQLLAKQLKQQAQTLIENGKMQEAAAILAELHNLLPEDKEVQELQDKLI